MTTLLTGATGFVGMEVLARLATETDRDVVALVRAADDVAAGRRLDKVLETILPPGEEPCGSLRAVAADLESPGLGLADDVRDQIAEDLDTVIHCAASVSFTLPLDEARRINVVGTEGVLELASRAPGLDRFVHVSTAYVAGDHRNTYERTKQEAERAVRSSGLPATIVRPSIVVGDSRTGWTPAFNVIYWPLQAFARGLFPQVPGDPDTTVDIVPIDTVADALLTLVEEDFEPGVIPIVAGDDAPTARELAGLAAAAFGADVPRFVAPGVAPEAEERAGAYLPYFRNHSVFDADRGRALGFAPPPIADYFDAIMGYARRARWGRSPAPRWEVSAARAR